MRSAIPNVVAVLFLFHHIHLLAQGQLDAVGHIIFGLPAIVAPR